MTRISPGRRHRTYWTQKGGLTIKDSDDFRSRSNPLFKLALEITSSRSFNRGIRVEDCLLDLPTPPQGSTRKNGSGVTVNRGRIVNDGRLVL
jgi:hypothetical protein